MTPPGSPEQQPKFSVLSLMARHFLGTRAVETHTTTVVDDDAMRISTISSGARGVQPTEWAFPTHRNVYDDLHTASAGILLPRRTAHLTLPQI